MMKAPLFSIALSTVDKSITTWRRRALWIMAGCFGLAWLAHGGFSGFNSYFLLSIYLLLLPLTITGINSAGETSLGKWVILLPIRIIPLAPLALMANSNGISYPLQVLSFPFAVALAYSGYNSWYASLYARANPASYDALRQKMMADSNGDSNLVGPEYPAEPPKIRFADIVGMEETKQRLLEAGNAIKHNDSGVVVSNGILLSGEPGNGKSLLAEALAGELELPFLPVTFGKVVSEYVNETTVHVMKAIEDARRQAPCLLFLDELDSLLRDRDQTKSGAAEKRDTVNALLTEIVNLRSSRVVIVAATNDLDALDKAGKREKRFDFKIEIPAPDRPAREAILRRAIKRQLQLQTPPANWRPRLLGLASQVAPSLTPIQVDETAIQLAAARWNGFSAARIDTVGEEAAKLAQKEQSTISYQLLQHALRLVQGSAGKLPMEAQPLEELPQTMRVKQPLSELLIQMQNALEIEAHGGQIPSGALFYGPTGTGKTMAAMAIAKSAGWAFLTVQGMDLIRDPSLMGKVFRDAADLRPCVLFIDEADDVLGARNGMNNSITNKLLTLMDGAQGKANDVLVVGATNHPDQLDPAVLRGGRFTVKIEFSNADETQVRGLIEAWRKSLKIQVSHHVSDDYLIERMVGMSAADIRNKVLQGAVNKAAIRSTSGVMAIIDRTDIEAAFKQNSFT
ncbi:AAA family ATPase [Chromobacterium vaccinii]|uniref:AAA family ATPase n=1 Tax=Chromobacterium vaccinii TaxID=1108595 RepID=UPI00345A64AB